MLASTLGLMVALALGARTPGDVAHYRFYQHECNAGSVAEARRASASSRVLNVNQSAGATCLELQQGVSLENKCVRDYTTTPNCTFSPLVSSTVGSRPDFAAEIGSGFTIEAWLAADPRPLPEANAHRVIVSLADKAPTADEPDTLDRCKVVQSSSDSSTPISFELLQMGEGCVAIKFKYRKSGDASTSPCVMLPADDTGLLAGGCGVADRLNMSTLGAGSQQHLVVSINGENPTVSGQPALPRFATYIDGVRVVDSETSDSNDARSYKTGLAMQFLPSGTRFNFSAVWSPRHVLRIGTDGLGGKRHVSSGNRFLGDFYAWGGRLHGLHWYGRALNASEVHANYAAGPDNSYPRAQAVSFAVLEDTCTQLPDLGAHIRDYDVDTLGRPQTLTAALAGTRAPARGALYSDVGCTQPLGAADDLPGVYFRAVANEFSAPLGAPFASPLVPGSTTYTILAWEARDGAGGTALGNLSIEVVAVNDEPVALPGVAEAYMSVIQTLVMNASDVDHVCAPGAGAQGVCMVRITQPPTQGTLFTLDGTPIAGLAVPSLTMPSAVLNRTLLYRSRTFPRDCSNGCPRQVGTDSFRFEVLDPTGAVSSASAPFELVIVGGLEARSTSLSPAAREEAPAVLTLRAINRCTDGPGWTLD